MTGAPGTRLVDFRREHGVGRPWPRSWLLGVDGLLGLLAVVAAVGFGNGLPLLGVVAIASMGFVPLLRSRLAAVPDGVAETHRRWLHTALPASDPSVEAVVAGSAPPVVGAPGVLVVRTGGQPRAVTVEHRSSSSGPVVTGAATGPVADRLLRVVRTADELAAGGHPVPADISAGDGESAVLEVAAVVEARRAAEATRPTAPPADRPAPPAAPPAAPAAPATPADRTAPPAAPPAPAARPDLPNGSLADALRMADLLQGRFTPTTPTPPLPTTTPPPTDGDPFARHARELAGLPPDDIAPGETRLFSTARLQHPDGWHEVAYEGRFVASTAAGIRWRARRPVVAALVDDGRRHPQPTGSPALEWQGDMLVVRVDGLVVEQVTAVEGWYDVPLLPGAPWHVLPLAERAGQVHHGSMESALADAQRALDAQRAVDAQRALAARAAPPADPTRPARRRPFLVSCAWMGLTTDAQGHRTADHAVEGTPVGLEEGPEGAPTLRWWTTSDGVAGLLLAVRQAWLRSTPPGARRTVPGITWQAGRTAVSFQHGGPGTPWVTLQADADGRFWVPPLGAPWELLGPGEGAATVHRAQGRSESVVRLDPER